MSGLRRLGLLLLASCLLIYSSEMHEVKIVDGAEKKPDRGNTDGLAYVDPLSIPSGPRALLLLNGMCFGAHVDRYEYTVCPFQNVTQRRIVGTRSTLLGIWGEWGYNETESGVVADPTQSGFEFNTMKFLKGHSCGRLDRSVSVNIKCGYHNFSIVSSSVKEVSNCEHSLTLGIPMACRLLSEHVIIRNEDATEEAPPATELTTPQPQLSDKQQQQSLPNTSDRTSTTHQKAETVPAALSSESTSADLKAKEAEINHLKQQIVNLKNKFDEVLKSFP